MPSNVMSLKKKERKGKSIWYMGGKFRQGKKIAEFAHRVLTPDRVYVEPFCGALGAASRVAHSRMILNDVCKPLILMWKGLYEGTIELPDCVTEEQYNHYKQVRDMDDWMTAFVGFGFAFGGKFFGTYARHTRGGDPPGVDYEKTQRQKRGSLKKIESLKECEVTFTNSSYDKMKIPSASIVYCDPPYANRTKAHSFEGKFDYNKYWEWCRRLTLDENILMLVTAFVDFLPDDFRVMHSWGDTVVRHYASKGSDGTNEVLACHRTQVKMFSKVSK